MKNVNESNITERLGKLETVTIKELSSFRKELTESITNDFYKLENKVENRLIIINEKVNERLEENFNKTKNSLPFLLTKT